MNNSIIGLIILVLDIIAIVDVFKYVQDTTKKILWILGIIIFPFVGMVVYFLVGKK